MMPIHPNLRQLDWLGYQDLVYERFAAKYPESRIEQDVRMPTADGMRTRQIDIAIWGDFLGHELFAVVDCKLHERRVDVRTVDSFIGLLQDVRADIGILVTNKGYTDGARRRAAGSGVKLDIVEFDRLELYSIELDFCEECDPGEDHHPGVVQWGMAYSLEGDAESVADVGRCDWCNSLHLRCLSCGEVTGIPEGWYGEEVECLGACGTTFLVTELPNQRGGPTESVRVSHI